jgi:hypothetical protein
MKSLSLKSRLYFWKSQKSLGEKSGEGWVFHFSNLFLSQKRFDIAGALSWWRIQSLGQSSGLFLSTASHAAAAAAAAATTTTTTTTTTRSRWNIGPQQLSVAEFSVTFKFFIETDLPSGLFPSGFPIINF